MGEFNPDNHYIYYCGQESLRKNEVAIIDHRRVKSAVLGCNLKNEELGGEGGGREDQDGEYM